MCSRITRSCAFLLALGGLANAAFAERQFSAVAPFPKSSSAREALTAPVAPAVTLVMDASDRSALPARSSLTNGAIPVGIVRDAPTAVSTSAASWRVVKGGHALQWRVAVRDAKALRVALEVQRGAAGLVARFSALRDGAEVTALALPRSGVLWSPILDGGDAIAELFAPDGVDAADIRVSLGRVADHFAGPLERDFAKSQWLAAACEVDLACESQADPVLARAGAASIKINWVEGYTAYACSATLLNAADGSFRPYVYTAAHCLATQAAADSLVSVWFYEKASCGGEDAKPAVQVPGGAQVVATDAESDVTLLRLNRTPPAGAVYAGWDTEPPAVGDSLVALHHANGEVTKVSHGTVIAPPPYGDFALGWTSGIVQGGSSGSGAFSRAAGKDDLLLRGALSGSSASCEAPGYGLYSRLDRAWPAVAARRARA